MIHILKIAKVSRKSFSMILHGVRIDIYAKDNQNAIKKKIEKDNRRLYLELDIVSTR